MKWLEVCLLVVALSFGVRAVRGKRERQGGKIYHADTCSGQKNHNKGGC